MSQEEASISANGIQQPTQPPAVQNKKEFRKCHPKGLSAPGDIRGQLVETFCTLYNSKQLVRTNKNSHAKYKTGRKSP